MNRKYLDDIEMKERSDLWNEGDERQLQWQEQREIYGFDERETWSLDNTFYCWLYERLMMFLEFAEDAINLEFYKFEINGEILTQRQCINKMIDGCKAVFESKGYPNEEQQKKIDDITKIWHEVIPTMWW